MSVYPSPNINRNKSLKEFLDIELTKLLPNQDTIIKNHLNLVAYLEKELPLFVLRKFGNFKSRGNVYSFENNFFTVSDNEPALWVFMETFNQSELDFLNLIENQLFPIAFAIKKEEKPSNQWKNIGRKHKSFSKNGWKHCHIFQCSPLGESIAHKNDLKKRSLRLLSPLNHFPFFSPRKYEMPIDYGENNECIEYVIWWLYNRFYDETNKIIFKSFVEGQGFSIAIEEPKDILIDYKLKDVNQTKTKKKNKVVAISNNIKKDIKTKSKSKNEVQIESTCFKISQNWYGQGNLITVNFPNGRRFHYDHDFVYDNTISHYEILPSWRDYGCNTSSKGIPKIAKPFVTEI